MTCSRCNVLVVDDNKAICHLLKVVLSEKGFSVDIASDGLEALKKVAESTPSVVLLDLKMPKMAGIETYKKLASLYPDLPVIVISAYANHPDIMDAKNRGKIIYYLTKPFSIYKLYEILKCLE